MILTDYLKYERLPNQKSKSRMDCTASTNTYEFDDRSFIYIGTNDHIRASRHRKADLSVTGGRGKHITSFFTTDINKGTAYGDNRDTTDLLLFVSQNFSMDADGRIADGAAVEVFVARGKKWDKNQVNNLFLDGQLDDEIARLRRSVTKSVTTDVKDGQLPNQ